MIKMLIDAECIERKKKKETNNIHMLAISIKMHLQRKFLNELAR